MRRGARRAGPAPRAAGIPRASAGLPKGQCVPSQVKLEPAVITALEKAPREASEILGGVALFCQILEQPLTKRPVDPPTVVRIDQAQVPQLRALVEVRYAGRG
jgi:hypothetical protein